MSGKTTMPFGNLEEDVGDLFKRAKRLQQEANHEGAIAALKQALATIERSGWSNADAGTKDERSAVLTWLADAHGMIGGRLRDLGRLAESRESYMRGRAFEQQGGALSSYNSVNLIATPIEQGTAQVADLRGEIDAAIDMLELQTQHGRAKDRWAWADLGQCLLLAGRVDRAKGAYRSMLAIVDGSDVGKTVDSVTRVLRNLERTLSARGDPLAVGFAATIEALEHDRRIKEQQFTPRS